MSNLPFVLLGIRSALRDSSGFSPAHLTYGSPLKLPGEFFSPSTGAVPDTSDFVAHLRHVLQATSPFPLEQHSSPSVHLPAGLRSCDSVFVRVDAVKRPLTPPYCGPYKVLDRVDKIFILDRAGKPWTVSVDRLKPLAPATPVVDPPKTRDSSSRPTSLLPPSSRQHLASPGELPVPSLPDQDIPGIPTSTSHPLSTALKTRSGRLIRPPTIFNL